MSISSTRYLGPLLLLLPLLLGGCASTPEEDDDIDLDAEREEVESRYAAEREGEAAAAADSPHVPLVPFDEDAIPQAREASEEYMRAMAAMRQGRLDDALIMLQSLSARYPELSGPLVNQGIIHLRRDDFEDAEQVLREALEVNDKNPYAYNALGVALREHGRFDEAEAAYREALDLDPQYARAHFNLGVLAELYKQDLVTAVEHFRAYQELQRDPDRTVGNWITDLERRAPEAVEAAMSPEEMDVEPPREPEEDPALIPEEDDLPSPDEDDEDQDNGEQDDEPGKADPEGENGENDDQEDGRDEQAA